MSALLGKHRCCPERKQDAFVMLVGKGWWNLIHPTCTYGMLPLSQVLGWVLRGREGRRNNMSLRSSQSRASRRYIYTSNQIPEAV